ncbi:hypothetical protein DPMN_081849 [Dreissena polymorpha]|uniref:Uncharacterized protein n=1 Tax=Dreissena polymorpha TaxID=45954 RepID=A0A9D3Y9E1_DREPO|nr:hypothetical protein DPMN_081849 [Dreissena polymorpha]
MDATVQSPMLPVQPDKESEPQPGNHIRKVIFVKSVKVLMEKCGYSVIHVILGYTENVQVCKMQENERNIQRMELNGTAQVVNN